MKKPNAKDYGIGAGYSDTIKFDPVGYIKALEAYIEQLETSSTND